MNIPFKTLIASAAITVLCVAGPVAFQPAFADDGIASSDDGDNSSSFDNSGSDSSGGTEASSGSMETDCGATAEASRC